MSKRKNFNKRKFFVNNQDKRKEIDNEIATDIPKKSFFKKWFRWDVISGVATILMLVLAIIAIIPPNPVNEMRERIKNNISIVESTFKPSVLKEENDSSKYLSLLADLQQSAIDYCILWKSLNDAEPYSKYSNLPPTEIANILSH